MANRVSTICVFASIMLMCFNLYAQQPIIATIDKTSGANHDLVTITGSGFGTNPASVSVVFGAVKGQIDAIRDGVIEARVPAGTTYRPVIVTNTSSGLGDQTQNQFLLSYRGEPGFAATNLEGQKDFNAETGLYDICGCDFDNNGKVDFIGANEGSNNITILGNTTANPGLPTITFNRIARSVGAPSVHAQCGDLDGDGKADLVISEGGPAGERLFILKNNSTGAGNFTFASQTINLTGVKVKRVAIADLDRNGKPEIIVTNQSGNTITILKNESNVGVIAIASTRITIPIPGASSSDALEVVDLNNDHKPEIITSQFLTAASNIFILPNASTPDNVAFSAISSLTISGTVINVRVGDLDGDAKPDIAATLLLNSGVAIFPNQSTSNVSFGPSQSVATDDRPWGIDFGDLDGDGKIDMAVASLTKKSITILTNASTPGSFSFQSTIKATTFINRHIYIGDVDGDAKPDVVFTSIDDNNIGVPASKISIFRNNRCAIPLISPGQDQTICASLPLTLETAPSAGVTFEWKNGATPVQNGPANTYAIAASGAYTVTAISEGGLCTKTSNTVNITVGTGTTSGTATATNNGPVCVGSAMTLSVNDVGATDYQWRGPGGYSGSGLSPAGVANFQQVHAGRYTVDIYSGSCIAARASTLVEAVPTPAFSINSATEEIVCAGAKTLSVSPSLATYAYQWFEKTTGLIAGATNASFNATSAGQYFVEARFIANPACAPGKTDEVKLTFASAPTAAFDAPTAACRGQLVNLTNQSVTDPAQTPVFTWSFGDTGTANTKDASHQYANAGNYTIKLVTSYANSACAVEATKPITITSAPQLNIISETGRFELCPNGTLRLTAQGDFANFLWSNGAVGESVAIRDAGSYSVDATTASGCVITVAKEIVLLDAPDVTITVEPAEVLEGQGAQLEASGLTTYEWTPAETLSQPNIANPVASPTTSTTYTVSGIDLNGCAGSASADVLVRGDLIIKKLAPSKFFSPDNGDEVNNFWVVDKILEYPQCEIRIYDEKGIEVFAAKPYDNTWDGTFKGRKLPDGVYYFIIKCEGQENTPLRGAVTLLR